MDDPSLKVVLVDEDYTRSALLAEALSKHGYQVIAHVEPGPSLLAKVAQLKPDMIVIDTESPSRDILESMSILNEHHPMPVIMFADEDDEAVVQEAIRSGVSGYVVRDTDPEGVKLIMSVAIARFMEYQALKDELLKTQNELHVNKLIQKAKRLLIKQKGATEEEAHQAMMRLSMDQNLPMAKIAQQIIDSLEI